MDREKELKMDEKTNTIKAVRLALSEKPVFERFQVWVIGDTPLITHAWTYKARIAMLIKQVGGTKPGKAARDPNEDFVNSLYEMSPGVYGFPVTGLKKAILASAHKDKGIARTAVMGALWFNSEMTRTRPALAGAMCDMPLIRIWGSDPEMREDMVKVGSGLNKTANLAYRAQFTTWALRVTGRLNPTVLNVEALAFLIDCAGMAFGLGEWRNERKGVFGAFHLSSEAEESAWEAFAAGNGPLPVPAYQEVV